MYYVTIDASGTTADLYVRANKSLTSELSTIDISNEKISYNTTDPTVPSNVTFSLTFDYMDNPIGTNLNHGDVVYLKFYLNVSSGQEAGMYRNNISFKVVPNGYTP